MIFKKIVLLIFIIVSIFSMTSNAAWNNISSDNFSQHDMKNMTIDINSNLSRIGFLSDDYDNNIYDFNQIVGADEHFYILDNGEIRFTLGTNYESFSYYNNTNHSGYREIVYSIKVVEEEAIAAFSWNLQDLGAGTTDGYIHFIDTNDATNSKSHLRKISNGGTVQIGTDTELITDLTIGDEYKTKIIINGSTFNVYINDIFVHSATDTDYGYGFVGFSNINSVDYNVTEFRYILNNTKSGNITTTTQNSLTGNVLLKTGFSGGLELNTSVDIYGNSSSDDSIWTGWVLIKLDALTDMAYSVPSALKKQFYKVRYVSNSLQSSNTTEISELLIESGIGGLQITSSSPSTPTTSFVNESKTFNASSDQSGNWTWFIDSVLMKSSETNTPNGTYTNSTAPNGTTYNNVTAIITNTNGSAQTSWDWTTLLNYITTNVTYYDRDNVSINMILNISYVSNGTQQWGFNYSGTDAGNTYHWTYSNNTVIQSLTATTTNETLQFVQPTLPVGVYYIQETLNNQAPSLSNISPSTPHKSFYIDYVHFNATSNQNSNNELKINGTTSSWNNGTNISFYLHGAALGSYNITIIAHNSTNQSLTDSNTWIWDVVSLEPPQNLTSTTDTDHIHFDWDDYPSADYWNISELEESAPYINTTIILDGYADSVYNDSAHGFIISTPNQISPSNYETVHWFRNNTHLIGHADGFDADALSNDDSFRIGIDNTGNGLTTDDRKFVLSESGTVTGKRWSGSSWLPQATSAEGIVVNAGGGGAISYEMIIPLSEMSGFVDGVTAKFFMERRDSSQNPDVSTFYPETLINTTDASIWADAELTVGEKWVYIDNTTSSEYEVLNLSEFTWYKHRLITINGSIESNPVYSTDITSDAPKYTVSGYIKDLDGLPISNATVYAKNGVTSEADTSNVSGYYVGEHFHNGSYTIYANATGYAINSTAITVAGVNLTNINITLLASTQQINITNLAVSPVTIKEGQTSTITVDANESTGSISSVTVTIDGSAYPMSATTGDTWSYTWTAPQDTARKYFITQVEATGTYSTNTTLQAAYIEVLSSAGIGMGGGGMPPSLPPLSVSLPDIDVNIPTEIVDTTGAVNKTIQAIENITKPYINILKGDAIGFAHLKMSANKIQITRTISNNNAIECDSTDPQVSCSAANGIITLELKPNIDESKIYQLVETHITTTDKDGNTHHIPISISILNLMAYMDFNVSLDLKNPYIVAVDPIGNNVIGLRLWWMAISVLLVGYMINRKYNT